LRGPELDFGLVAPAGDRDGVAALDLSSVSTRGEDPLELGAGAVGRPISGRTGPPLAAWGGTRTSTARLKDWLPIRPTTAGTAARTPQKSNTMNRRMTTPLLDQLLR
jgi:hypothetical protein